MADVIAQNRRTGERQQVSRYEYDYELRDEGWKILGTAEPEVEPEAEPDDEPEAEPVTYTVDPPEDDEFDPDPFNAD